MKLRTTMMIAGAMLPLSAYTAAATSEEESALLDRLNKLEQEVIVLRSQLNTEKPEQSVEKTEVAKNSKSAESKNPTSLNWKGAPEVKSNGGWSVKPRGRILYDFANLSSVPDSVNIDGEGFSAEARRIRLGIQGTMPGGFGYKLETDLPGGATLTDAYVDYKNDGLKVIIGQHNNFQGMEELSSSNDTSFIERAAYTDAFGFQRKVGISASFKAGSLNVQTGIFTDNIDDLDDGNNTFSIDGRVFSSPKVNDMQLHFGGSVHLRDLGDSFDTVRYRARPSVHSVDTRFINTNNIAGAEKESSYGLEAAVIAGRFHASAEMHTVKVDRNGFEDPSFTGAAIEAGYFLTNDTRGYKGGVFKGVKVSEPFNAGGIGAWQVNVRFDQLDLVDAGIVGGTQDAYMASLIWTPINNVRFLINYAHISYADALDIIDGAPNDFSVNAWGARTQVSF